MKTSDIVTYGYFAFAALILANSIRLFIRHRKFMRVKKQYDNLFEQAEASHEICMSISSDDEDATAERLNRYEFHYQRFLELAEASKAKLDEMKKLI